jgi:hypothetical protein
MSAGSESISAKGDKMTKQSVVKLRLWLALFVSVAFVAFAPQQVTVESLPGTDFSRLNDITPAFRHSPVKHASSAPAGRSVALIVD